MNPQIFPSDELPRSNVEYLQLQDFALVAYKRS